MKIPTLLVRAWQSLVASLTRALRSQCWQAYRYQDHSHQCQMSDGHQADGLAGAAHRSWCADDGRARCDGYDREGTVLEWSDAESEMGVLTEAR